MATIRIGEVHSKDVPPGISEYLELVGGKNLYGQPMYTIAWANNLTKETRTEYPDLGGVSVVERPRRLKYGKSLVKDRFVIERWQPPSAYGDPADWVETEWLKTGTIVDYGPYPHQGRYTLVDIVEDSNSQYVEPTRAYIDAVLLASRNKELTTPGQEMAYIRAQEEREEEERFNRRLDIIKDANRPSNFHDVWVSMNTPGK
jgi:hypothetical protein